VADSRRSSSPQKRKSLRPRGWLDVVRYVLPAAVVLGGVVVMAFGDESQLEGGAGIVSAGLAIFFLNWLFRAGVSGDREREAEQAARDYFERHGRWPDG
jgi:hypothetical protein